MMLLRYLAAAVELPPGFIAETLATNLNAATAITPLPDGRILVAEQTGRLLVWKDGRLLDSPALTLRVTDYWERGLIGVILHPDFARTPHVFLLYVTDKPFVHHVLARFTMNGDVIDPATEKILLEGDDQSRLGGFQPAGHQGGVLRFGTDEKLYISIGEQTAGEPSQKLDTLQGKILRLSADGAIPEDNPFYSRTAGKYRAIWAYGVRNAFGLAAQPETGRMFFTDVGGSAFEEVNELTRGANYGWPRAEGFSTNAAFANPLHAYPPMIGRSICGGTFYPKSGVLGSRSNGVSKTEGIPAPLQYSTIPFPPKWRGRFFFLDYMNHWLKALDPDAPTNVITFARGFNGPVAVEVAADGSLLVLNRGTIWRDPKKFVTNSGSLVLIRYSGHSAPAVEDLAGRSGTKRAAAGMPVHVQAMPRRISRSMWESWKQGRPGELWGALPALEWHPHVAEESGFCLPAGTTLRVAADGQVQFPIGTVFIRDFLVFDHPAFRPPLQPLETRIIVVASASSAFGCSYRWTSLTEAELVEDGEVISRTTTTVGNRKREVRWWFPGWEEQIPLPSTLLSYLIPGSAAELNLRAGADASSLLRHGNEEGWIEWAPDAPPLNSIAALENWENTSAAPEARVRSYLHANCSVCHQPGGASRGLFDARITTPLEEAGILNGPPAAGDLGIASAKIVAPGEPEHSLLYQRLKRTDFFRMPPIQYHDELSPILPIMADWIRSLPRIGGESGN